LGDGSLRRLLLYVFESGTFRRVFGAYREGDRFRVAIEGGVARYRRNGVLFCTSAGARLASTRN